jgi:tRNA (mo5U34)-methyltransferase
VLSVIQFKAIEKLGLKQFTSQNKLLDIFPAGIEELPDNINFFDTVFSMGVIYHRKNPLEHLAKIKSFLRPGGEMVLETLVIDGSEHDILNPKGRYAQMRNVWQIPSVKCLEKWVKEAGFCEIRTIDVTTTTIEEQRSTEWMHFHSLINFLDPEDNSKTVEGYPAPKRATIIAQNR